MGEAVHPWVLVSWAAKSPPSTALPFSILIDLLAMLLTNIISGSDATAHMVEEVKDADFTVPKAVVWPFVLNGVLGLFFIISYLFCLPFVEDALNDLSTFPFLYVFRQAVSTSGVNALTIVILILAIDPNIAFNASTSRQTFAFARDNDLPFPN
jgi:amino acid transporter